MSSNISIIHFLCIKVIIPTITASLFNVNMWSSGTQKSQPSMFGAYNQIIIILLKFNTTVRESRSVNNTHVRDPASTNKSSQLTLRNSALNQLLSLNSSLLIYYNITHGYRRISVVLGISQSPPMTTYILQQRQRVTLILIKRRLYS